MGARVPRENVQDKEKKAVTVSEEREDRSVARNGLVVAVETNMVMSRGRGCVR